MLLRYFGGSRQQGPHAHKSKLVRPCLGLAACAEDTGTDPPPPSISVSVVSPRGGTLVNEDVPPEEPVEFSLSIRNATSPTVTWSENGVVFCQGNPCSAVMAVGTHAWVAEVWEGNRIVANPSGVFTIRPDSLWVEITSPEPEAEIRRGDVAPPCRWQRGVLRI
jgi:hypothetical protein